MKLFQKLAVITSVAVLTVAPSLAQTDGLPDSGTYFIVNAASGEALQPAAPSVGQNVMVYEFKKGGTQKWTITRKINPVTKKPTNRYNIRLAGENQELNFQPHPSVPDAAAIISTDLSVLELESNSGGYAIKSVVRNGDALYIAPNPPMDTEVKFGTNDRSDKFRWSFINAE